MKPFSLMTAAALAATLYATPARAQQPSGSLADATAAPPASIAAQQSNVPAPAQHAEGAVEDTVRRYRIGVDGAVGLDPELIMFGAHGTFTPIFTRAVEFRPGIEFGFGEVTTMLGINLDVTYALPGGTRTAGWTPYVGAGPNFTLSHEGFDTTDFGSVTTPTTTTTATGTALPTTDRGRF